MKYYTLLESDKWILYKDGKQITNGRENGAELQKIADKNQIESYIIQTYFNSPYLLEKSFLKWEQGRR